MTFTIAMRAAASGLGASRLRSARSARRPLSSCWPAIFPKAAPPTNSGRCARFFARSGCRCTPSSAITITREEGSRAAYEALFGRTLNYRFDVGDCQFLALDTTQGRSVYRTRIAPETLAWVEAELPRLSPKKPVIVLTHFPLGRNWLRPTNAHALVERLRPYGLQASFSGHWHGLTDRTEGPPT